MASPRQPGDEQAQEQFLSAEAVTGLGHFIGLVEEHFLRSYRDPVNPRPNEPPLEQFPAEICIKLASDCVDAWFQLEPPLQKHFSKSAVSRASLYDRLDEGMRLVEYPRFLFFFLHQLTMAPTRGHVESME